MSVNEMLMAAAGAGGPSEYVEDVFSTWLYTGNGSTQTITNGIDLAGKGGIVWGKVRSSSGNHWIMESSTGGFLLSPNTTESQSPGWGIFPTASGYSFAFGGNYGSYVFNQSGVTEVSWTFRKAPKFFDVVTYTGNGGSQNISHSLSSKPGMIIIKALTSTTFNDWAVWARVSDTSIVRPGSPSVSPFGLNLVNAGFVSSGSEVNGANASTFNPEGMFSTSAYNTNGVTYVAYLFAHNAGGFGDAGTDNIISCGSFTGAATVNLGWEPQYILFKRTDGTQDWFVMDTMRGIDASGAYNPLNPNLSAAEGSFTGGPTINATGFSWIPGATASYIYMAIRRPMKKPTSGTEVYSPIARAGTSDVATITGVGFAPDTVLIKPRNNPNASSVDWCHNFFDRIRGPGRRLSTAFTNAENTSINFITSLDMDGMTLPSVGYNATNGGYNYINHFFRRAPGFFDVVCYTGNSTAGRTVPHNLGVAPELMIIKARSVTEWWYVYQKDVGATQNLQLNETAAAASWSGFLNNTAPSSTDFTLGSGGGVNTSPRTYVAYLFASCPGVSKVGSYTGNGSSQTINCGFSAGARFVLIKRTDSTGDWCVFDTARGIVSGNDPFLQLNSTDAEVTGEDAVDPVSSGFIVNQTTENLNVNAASYIYLAIA